MFLNSAEVDVQRLGAKQPVGVVQEFRAAAGRPSSLSVLVGLSKCAEILILITAADAVIAELVINLCVGQTAGGIEQPIVVDNKANAATKCP